MNKYGLCKLCGKTSKLTFEHVPPRSVFNNAKVKLIDALETIKEDRLPWEVKDLEGRIQQKGKGGYYLCSECNNNTGAWYVPEYEKFVMGIYNALVGLDWANIQAVKIQTKKIKPLAILKQVLVMFCDINNNCFGDEKLRKFLLDKEDNSFDLKGYKVFLYINKGNIEKQIGLSGVANIYTGRMDLVSEIASFPIGMKLFLDKDENFKTEGLDITDFCRYSYEEEIEYTFVIPLLEVNIFFPEDYRKKEDIVPEYQDLYKKL